MNPSKVKIFNSKDLKNLISMDEAIDLMEEAFATLSSENAHVPQRVIMNIPNANLGLFFKPAYVENLNRLSIKILTQTEPVIGSNIPSILGMVMLIDASSGEILSLCDGEYLTSLRTGAAAGIATKLLARSDSKVLSVFGCGPQGLTQIEATCRVRDFDTIYVYDLDESAAHSLIKKCTPEIAKKIRYTTDLKNLKETDVICTATGSRKPLFTLNELKPGVHINAIGSYKPDMQELACDVVSNSRVFVEEKESSLAESGDLIIPIDKGMITPDAIAGEIGQLCLKQKEGRLSDTEITVFKSVGNAIQDFYIANAVYEKSLSLTGDLAADITEVSLR